MNKPNFHLTNGRFRSLGLGLMVVSAAALLPTSAATPEPTADARWLTAPVAEVRVAAEGGAPAAQHALGERFLRGRDGRADLLAAYDWFARAGSNGVVEAQLRMGMKHERAVAGPRDIAEAARWYQLAAEKGSDAARFRLACVNSLNRHAGRLDAAETVRWAQPLAERGHGPSLLLRAANAPPPQAVAWVREGAQLGDPRLARRLSNLLAPTDAKEATYWDAVARATGDTSASFPLARAQGNMSQAEIAAETTRAKAFQPRRVVFVPLGDLEPLHHLDVELQPTAAARAELARLDQAAQRGEAAAQFQLALVHQLAPAFTNHLAVLDGSRRSSGSLLLNNDRVPQPHLDAAVRWHTAAAKQGHRDAALCLVWLYQSGVLDLPRPADALPWLKVAADAGHAESAYQLYHLRLGGLGVEKTNDQEVKRRQYAETLDWLKRAAELNHLPAMTNHAAQLYRAGDQTQALRFLRAAADRGDAGSALRLKDWFGITHAAPGQPVAAAPSGTPRLAVVPLAENLRPLADLLTAELSVKPGVVLVERTELDRVFREQNLNAANTSALKLGELLNAQGVILLETNAAASVRFVAVGPGVLLAAAELPLPLTNAPDWSRQLSAQFSPWLGKLAVTRGAAVPVSLLGLRMATVSADGPEIEQGLSLLFLHRLTREREVFALERRRLDQLSAEQELTGATNNFWSGGSLVDGAIERDLGDRTRLSVRMRVTPAGGQRVNFEAAGSTTNLAALADSLAVKLLMALKRTPTGTWDPQEEAITFYEEARWLRRWGQWEPALAAMESAWALGLRGPTHAVLRQELLLTNFRFVALRWSGSGDFPSLLRQPPEPANLDWAARALTAYSSHSRGLSPEALVSSPPWLALGAATLEMAGRTIEEFYLAPEYWAGRTEQLAGLRADTKAFHDYLRLLHVRAKTAGSWDNVDSHFRNSVLGMRHGDVSLTSLEVAYLRYWAERPEEVLGLHRRLQGQADYDLWRGYFDSAKPTPLAAWNPAERVRLRALWAAHLRGLAATNLPSLFEQELAVMRSVRNSPWQTAEPKLTAAIGRFLGFAWTQRDALARHAAGSHTISSVLAAARKPFAFYDHEPVGARLEALVASHEKRLRDFQAEIGLPVAAAFLREAKQEDAEKFNDLVARPNFSATRAGELLLLARQYDVRFRHPPSHVAGLRRLAELVSPPAGTSAPAATVVTAKTSVPLAVASVATVPAPTPGTPGPDALRVTRFWLAPELRRTVQSFVSFPLAADHRVDAREIEIHDWLWEQGRLWVSWRHDLSVHLGREAEFRYVQECSHIAGYSLPDLTGDLNPDGLPVAVGLPRTFGDPRKMPLGRFAVLAGQLYVSGSNAVWRVAKERSEPLKLEITGQPLLAVVHGRLLISAPDELYAYDVKLGTAELLVSGRRRPAANAADPFAAGLAQVAELSGQRVRVIFAGSGAFDFDFATKTWASLPAAPGNTRRVHADQWEALNAPGNGVFTTYLLPHSGTNWQLAALRLPPPPRDIQALSSGMKLPGVPRWQPVDRELSPAYLATTSLSNRYWSITGLDFHKGHTNADTFLLSTNGCHVRLAAWRMDSTQPAVIPLWLELPPGTLTPGAVSRAQMNGYFGKFAAAPGNLLATPSGLAFRAEAVPGFWFIPWSDVLSRVEAQFTQLAATRDARPDPGNHRGKQLLRAYDLDYDGKVTGGEFAALFSGEKLDSDSNASRMLFMHFNNADKNRDGGLDGTELSAIGDLIKSRAAGTVTGVRSPGFSGPGGPGAPGRFPPRPGFSGGPGKPFGSGQLPQGPPPPEILERYDKNKNGKMDPDEMQEFLRDAMSGKSPRPRGTNVPPGVPVPAPTAPPAKP